LSWSTETVEEQREEFRRLALHVDANVSELCRRYGISRKTGYKWLAREQMSDRSRRPKSTPTRTAAELESRVVELRGAHPAWGGRKIAHVLKRDQGIEIAPSTVTSVLRRHGLIDQADGDASKAWLRFEHPRPNSLWQMDFKGHFALGSQRCHPLTVLDDHSRFNVALKAMSGEDGNGVRAALDQVFRRYGLPECINTDNGPPWGSGGRGSLTALNVWVIRLGIRASHSTPYHPQTNGKDERFHRTLKAEVLSRRNFDDFDSLQQRLDAWRAVYNLKRPHEALDMKTPAERYEPSPRSMPSTLPPIEYSPDDQIRKVQAMGIVKFKGRRLRIGLSLHGLPVAFRADPQVDGVYDVFFCHQRVDRVDLNEVQSEPT
jgi:transposase InsO family protein